MARRNGGRQCHASSCHPHVICSHELWEGLTLFCKLSCGELFHKIWALRIRALVSNFRDRNWKLNPLSPLSVFYFIHSLRGFIESNVTYIAKDRKYSFIHKARSPTSSLDHKCRSWKINQYSFLSFVHFHPHTSETKKKEPEMKRQEKNSEKNRKNRKNKIKQSKNRKRKTRSSI